MTNDPQQGERMLRIELALEALTSEMQDIARSLRSFERLMHGESGKPGLLVRIDRLEQSNAILRRMAWALTSGVVGLVFYAVKDALL